VKKINIKENFNLVTMAVILVIGGAAFFGGMKYQQSKVSPAGQGQFVAGNPFSGNRNRDQAGAGTNTQTGVGQRRMGNGQVIGEISGVDTKSITVKSADGSSKIILISDKTAINKATSGQISDLKVGEKVSVFGTANTDGSVSGQNIQLNPAGGEPNVPSGTPTGK
jgi:hypothetical protein